MKKIMISGTEGDYDADLETNDEFWGCGRTIAEAIGNLVMHDMVLHYCKEFDIQIEFENTAKDTSVA